MAAPQQRGVAGEAAARHDPDEGHLPAQGAEQGKGCGVETGHGGRVGVAGAAAAPLGEEHDRQPQPLDQLEQPVLLQVVHLALRAGQDGEVVGEDGATGVVAEQVAVHPPDAGDQPVGRRVGLQVRHAPTRPLGRDDQPAVLLEGAGVAQVLDVLPGRPSPPGVPALRRLRSPRVERGPDPGPQLGQLGSDPTLRLGPFFRHHLGGFGPLRRPHREQHVTGLHGITHGDPDRLDHPGRLGLDDVLHLHRLEHDQHRPGADRVTGSDRHLEHGAGERHRNVGQPGHSGSGTSKPTSVPQEFR